MYSEIIREMQWFLARMTLIELLVIAAAMGQSNLF